MIVKYCENTRARPEQQLQAAHAQRGSLRRSMAGDHALHVILLGVGGVIYIPHTLVPLKSLGLSLIRKESRNSLSSFMLILCTKLISLCRPDVILSILLTFKLIRRGLPACLPATLTGHPFLFW